MADPKAPQLPPASYVNVMQVSHTQAEFFLQFGQLSPEKQGLAHAIQTLVTSPTHAKAMLDALRDNVEKYEKRHGKIREVITPATATKGSA